MDCRPILTFLELPKHVRITIYTLAGLVRPCPIDMFKEGKRGPYGYISRGICVEDERILPSYAFCPFGDHNWGDYELEDCYAPKLPLSLLRVSKHIAENMDLERMSLYIKFPDTFCDWCERELLDTKGIPTTSIDARHQAIFVTLPQIKDLNKFFAYRGYWAGPDIESLIEWEVKGDDYDSSKHGKPESPYDKEPRGLS